MRVFFLFVKHYFSGCIILRGYDLTAFRCSLTFLPHRVAVWSRGVLPRSSLTYSAPSLTRFGTRSLVACPLLRRYIEDLPPFASLTCSNILLAC